MKKQRRWILLLLLATVTLVSCGKENTETGTAPVTEETEVVTSEQEQEAIPEELPEETKEEKKVSPGTWENGVYTNEFAGLTFINPENWKEASEEEIARLMEVGREVMDNISEYEKMIAEQDSIYDMITKDQNTGNNVIVMYENLDLIMGASGMTPKEYLQNTGEQINRASSTVTYEVGEIGEMEVCGETYSTLDTRGEYNGVHLQQLYLVRKVGGLMVDIIVTSMDETPMEDLLEGFQ